MNYINTITSITYQNSFRVNNVWDNLVEINNESELVSPDFKEFIPPASLRRLSPVLRIGLAAAIECQNNSTSDFDAISVGTALGCLRDTEKFLVTFLTATSDFLSPTAFIQSTHNTIGGQISLGLKNHAYNMTHTQNNLSFEVALLDGIMCLNDGKTNVLVGAAEEEIPFLKYLQPSLINEDFPLSTGGTFFSISGDKNDHLIGVQDVFVNFSCSDPSNDISSFLSKNNIENPSLILTDGLSVVDKSITSKVVSYLPYTGLNYSASAFAVHMAHDYLKSQGSSVLIINHLCKGRLGLTLVCKA